MKRLKTFEAYHGYGPQRKRLLINQKHKFVPLLKQLTDADDVEFSVVNQRDRWTAISFIENGNPSEYYMEKILDILKSKKVDTGTIEEKVSFSISRPSFSAAPALPFAFARCPNPVP